LTKAAAVAPDGSCPIPTWSRVIDRATGQDRELASYLQRLVGYSLTGSTREHALAFWYGTGANSKTTILTAITGVFGDYHHTAPIETFTATNIDRHPLGGSARRPTCDRNRD
jgi:putative DNA primase/helicase